MKSNFKPFFFPFMKLKKLGGLFIFGFFCFCFSIFCTSCTSCKQDKSSEVKTQGLYMNGKKMMLEGVDFSMANFPSDTSLSYNTVAHQDINVEYIGDDTLHWFIDGVAMEKPNAFAYSWPSSGQHTIAYTRGSDPKKYTAFIKIGNNSIMAATEATLDTTITEPTTTKPTEVQSTTSTNNTYNTISQKTQAPITTPLPSNTNTPAVTSSPTVVNTPPPPPPAPKPKVEPSSSNDGNKSKSFALSYSTDKRCPTKSYVELGSSVTIKPMSNLELKSFKVIANKSGKVNITIKCESNGEKETINGKSIIGGAPTEISLESLDYELAAGKVYSIFIKPTTDDMGLEVMTSCNSPSSSNEHAALSFDAEGGVFFDMRFKY